MIGKTEDKRFPVVVYTRRERTWTTRLIAHCAGLRVKHRRTYRVGKADVEQDNGPPPASQVRLVRGSGVDGVRAAQQCEPEAIADRGVRLVGWLETDSWFKCFAWLELAGVESRGYWSWESPEAQVPEIGPLDRLTMNLFPAETCPGCGGGPQAPSVPST